jgi:hypothetical protein
MDNEFREEVMRSLGRIEGKMESLSDINERVTVLENWKNYIMGGLAMAAFAFAHSLKQIFYGRS